MNLYLEKRPDGTYYFRQTKLVNKKQVVKRISLKTRSAKIAKLLAIQLLAKIHMDKINKFGVEYDSKGNLIKLDIANEEDKNNFLETQIFLEQHRVAQHKRELEILELEARVNKVKTDNEEAKRDKSLDAQNLALHEKLSNKFAGAPLKDIFEAYLTDISVTAGVHGKYRRVISDFIKFCADDEVRYLSQVDRKLVFSYIVYLRKKENMTDKTIKNRLGVLSTFFNFQFSAGQTIAANPFIGHKIKPEDEESRQPFTIKELNQIFASNFVKNNQQNKFILLLLLTTAARPNEICQLNVDDVYIENDSNTNEELYIIRIKRDVLTNQTVKTRTSKRRVYLHELLIKNQFLEYLKTRSGIKLFDLNKPADKGYSAFFSEDFTKLLREDLKIEKKVLYCFRHTSNNRLKQALVNEVIREDLLGHLPAGENEKTYTQQHSPVNLRNATQEILYYREVTSLHN
ncbi:MULTISPECIES: phage integrase SAM-like domain-containing protein [unclassified Methylophilus]|uniref:phage integrase SAM-like domain-containing protein n=1 Tax=unclassified Methylophilus TaxID=2630143 RepID=UPI00037B8FA5|nr:MULTISPECIES: phage integrase SAM-like domain-containing protein [unclassified Methylophilus]